jgi:hypothetical protein
MFGPRKKKKEEKKKGKKPSATRTASHIFHGVGIVSGESPQCSAARAIADQRFLSEEAPRLPLADCSNPQLCTCTYRHFDDRRTDLRRESDEGLPIKDHPDNARNGFGRRITDG